MIDKLYDIIKDNKKNTVLFILILTFIASVPIFTFNGINKADDTAFHLSRICAIADNIKETKFFNGVYPGYLNDYGYANGLFYPDIFLYIPAILCTLGINVVISYKLFIVLINFLSIGSVYISIKGISKNTYASILGSIIYAFASYRLVDLYERAALGEALAFIFIPLIVYGIYEILWGNYNKNYILIIGMSGLILSHVVSTYIFGIALLLIVLINIKRLVKEKRIQYLILTTIITLLITSFFVFPMIEQMSSQKFYFSKNANAGEFELSKRTVPPYSVFLEIPYLSNLSFYEYWIPPGIGIIFLYLIYKKIKHIEIKDEFITQNFILGVLFLLLTTIPFFWNIDLVKKILYPIQFPWRFYIISTTFLTIAGSILMSKINESKKLLKNTMLISMVSLIFTIIVVNSLPIKIYRIEEYDVASAEYLPIEVQTDYIKQRGDIITSNGKIEYRYKKKGTTMEIEVNSNEQGTYLELPLIYYNGYNAKTEKAEIETFKTEHGLLGVKINDIAHEKITVMYSGTKLAKTTKIISFASFVLFVIFVVYVNKKKQ